MGVDRHGRWCQEAPRDRHLSMTPRVIGRMVCIAPIPEAVTVKFKVGVRRPPVVTIQSQTHDWYEYM